MTEQVATVSHIVHPGPGGGGGSGAAAVVGVHAEWLALLEEVQRKVALLQRKVDAGHHLQRAADDYGMLTRKPFLGYRYGQTVRRVSDSCGRRPLVVKKARLKAQQLAGSL